MVLYVLSNGFEGDRPSKGVLRCVSRDSLSDTLDNDAAPPRQPATSAVLRCPKCGTPMSDMRYSDVRYAVLRCPICGAPMSDMRCSE